MIDLEEYISYLLAAPFFMFIFCIWANLVYGYTSALNHLLLRSFGNVTFDEFLLSVFGLKSTEDILVLYLITVVILIIMGYIYKQQEMDKEKEQNK